MTNHQLSIFNQMYAIFDRYRQIGIPGIYIWVSKKFRVIGEGNYHINRKADNDNSQNRHI